MGSLKQKDMQLINTSRLVIFATLAEALASDRLIFANEIALISGDGSRFKRGIGIENSNDGLAKTFTNLPWSKADKETLTALNSTGTLTAAGILGGIISSTSAAAVTATLPTAADLASAVGAKRGTTIDFAVDNSAGSNTVTVAASTGITAATAVITGGATLTVASGKVGFFRIYYISATVALIYRLA